MYKVKIQIFLIFLIMPILSYFTALSASGIGDDFFRINYNPVLNTFSDIFNGQLPDRPFLNFTLFIDKFFFGLNPVIMKVHTLIYQALLLTSAFFWIKKDDKTQVPFYKSFYFWIFLIFSFHPVNSQAITSHIQRGVILALLFGWLTLKDFWIYSDTYKKNKYLQSLLFFILSILSKPVLILTPFILIISLYRKNKKNYITVVPYFLITLIPVIIYTVLGVNKNSNSGLYYSIDYLLVQAKVFFTYLKLVIFPYGLKFFYNIQPIENLFLSPNWLLVFIISTAFFWGARKYKTSMASFMFLIGVSTYLPESSIFVINHYAFEHRIYIPLFYFIFALSIKFKNIELKIPIYTIIALYSVILLSLNQIRNQQLVPLENWILHTYSNFTPNHLLNFRMYIHLIKKGYIKEVDELIQNQKVDYPEANSLYFLLNDISNYYKNKTKSNLKKIFLSTKNVTTQQPDLINDMIGLLNLESRSTNLLSDFDKTLLYENVLSPRTKVMINSRYKKSFSTLHFQVLKRSKDYLLNLKNINITEQINLLRIRYILVKYYKNQDVTLKNDIIKTYKKNKSNNELKYLYQQIE